MADFYQSKEWRKLRSWALSKYGAICMSCGSTEEIQCDHILPKSLYPRLRLNKANVQILCKPCNLRKSNVYIDDLRPVSARLWYWVIKWAKRLIMCSVITLLFAIWSDLLTLTALQSLAQSISQGVLCFFE